ncbi:MAG: HDOD domain-containing protein [Chthonomonadaceae bacterium]|nr:HDOD domain-containing protein [Chthonomonadaceae bacterium]
MFMARQPIYDGNTEVEAYELLFRRGDQGFAGDVNLADSASALTTAVVELGLEQLVGARRAFVNIPYELLVSDCLQVLPPDRVVIELLETIEPTLDVIEAVKKLKGQGYTIALDDYVFEGDLDALIDLADIIKVDVMGVDPQAVKSKIFKFRKRGIRLLAEKVETHEMFRLCRSIGFELFQGYFFAKPELMRGKGAPGGIAVVQLLTKLQDPMVRLSELEGLINNDVSLNYRLLKLVRSAYVGVGGAVDSVGQALAFLGTRRTLALVSLLAMSGMNDKPDELLITAMIRARLCELAAAAAGLGPPEKFFTVGLMSVIDALLDMTMETLLPDLPLSDEINAALLGTDTESPLSELLRCVYALERGDWDKVSFLQVAPGALADAYVSAVRWAAETNQALAA